jgi:tetratricopeptide (TPR) repeat protein
MNRMEKLRAFLEQQPEDVFLQHALALEYEKTGDIPAAIGQFAQLLSNHPKATGSYFHYARLLVQTGQTEKALKAYQQGMEACRVAGDAHALRELQGAYDELAD